MTPGIQYEVFDNILKVRGSSFIKEFDEEFERHCRKLLESAVHTLVFDLTELQQVNSTCVIMAGRIFSAISGTDKTFTVRARTPGIRLFEICGFKFDRRIQLETVSPKAWHRA